ncbi:hypothetical protein HGRIS_013413 [Hohenbuehelia grisea]
MTADAITAGSTLLLLQTALPIVLFAPPRSDDAQQNSADTSSKQTPSTLILRGGTNASLAPQIEYAQHVLLPFIKRQFGIDEATSILVKRRGYFPKGGGEVHVSVPSRTKPLLPIQLLERGKLRRIDGIAHLGLLPSKFGRDMVEGATAKLARSGILPLFGAGSSDPAVEVPEEARVPIDIRVKRESNDNCPGAGSGIVLWAELEGGGVIGASALGRKNLPPYEVGETAVEELLQGLNAGGCVDEYLQDQIIIFMALAAGTSSIRTGPLSLHTKTAIWVAEQLTSAKFEVVEENSGQCIIHCHGIGYTAPIEAQGDAVTSEVTNSDRTADVPTAVQGDTVN